MAVSCQCLQWRPGGRNLGILDVCVSSSRPTIDMMPPWLDFFSSSLVTPSAILVFLSPLWQKFLTRNMSPVADVGVLTVGSYSCHWGHSDSSSLYLPASFCPRVFFGHGAYCSWPCRGRDRVESGSEVTEWPES